MEREEQLWRDRAEEEAKIQRLAQERLVKEAAERAQEEERARAALEEIERTRQEEEAAMQRRRERELGPGVGMVQSKYTKLLNVLHPVGASGDACPPAAVL